MTTGNAIPTDEPHPADQPFFSARLTPHRSLGPRGFLLLMLGTGAIAFGAGSVFLAIGAWPVFGFFGLDVLVIYVAFRLSYRQARAFEEIHVSATDVHVVRVAPHGRSQEYHLNPAWARLEVSRLPDEGVVAIALTSHGRSLPIGSFLNPADRASFADALSAALATARRGGPSPAEVMPA